MAVQNLSSHQGPSICRVKNNLQYPILKLLPKTAQNYIMDHLTQQSINARSSVCVSHTGTYTKLLYTNKGLDGGGGLVFTIHLRFSSLFISLKF